MQRLVLQVNDQETSLQIRTTIDGQEILANLAMVSRLAQNYASNSRSKNTMKSYGSDWRDFDFWCQGRGLIAMPADPRSIACYLADRASQSFINQNGNCQSPLKTSTLARRLSAISQAHQIAGKASSYSRNVEGDQKHSWDSSKRKGAYFN